MRKIKDLWKVFVRYISRIAMDRIFWIGKLNGQRTIVVMKVVAMLTVRAIRNHVCVMGNATQDDEKTMQVKI